MKLINSRHGGKRCDDILNIFLRVNCGEKVKQSPESPLWIKIEGQERQCGIEEWRGRGMKVKNPDSKCFSFMDRLGLSPASTLQL